MKRLLVIAYYWPPSGGSGVQRWVKFSKYLPAEGWQPVVYTPSNPSAPATDASLEADIPSCVEVVRRPIREIGSLFRGSSSSREVNPINAQKKSLRQRLMMWIRGNCFIPDPRRSWVGPSVRFLSRYLREHPVDAIVTTGPPHSMHLIGLKLSRKTGLPWVADFRDPWTKIFYFKHLHLSPWAARRHQALEQAVLDGATRIVAVSPPVADDFRSMTRTPVVLITNGFDPADYPAMGGANAQAAGAVVPVDAPVASPLTPGDATVASPLSPVAAPVAAPLTPADAPVGGALMADCGAGLCQGAPGTFSLVHTGLFAADGNPLVLWKVLAAKYFADEAFRKALRIVLIGKTDAQVIAAIREAGLGDALQDLGYRDHSETVVRQQSASVLLLPLRQEPEYRNVLPGKLFEYLGARRPVLGIGQSDGAMATILSDVDAGQTFDWTDESGLSAWLDDAWTRFGNGRLDIANADIDRFSRRSTARQMASLLDSITG